MVVRYKRNIFLFTCPRGPSTEDPVFLVVLSDACSFLAAPSSLLWQKGEKNLNTPAMQNNFMDTKYANALNTTNQCMLFGRF